MSDESNLLEFIVAHFDDIKVKYNRSTFLSIKILPPYNSLF